jgi:hypothetical protein
MFPIVPIDDTEIYRHIRMAYSMCKNSVDMVKRYVYFLPLYVRTVGVGGIDIDLWEDTDR